MMKLKPQKERQLLILETKNTLNPGRFMKIPKYATLFIPTYSLGRFGGGKGLKRVQNFHLHKGFERPN